jgi:hypothetical protein
LSDQENAHETTADDPADDSRAGLRRRAQERPGAAAGRSPGAHLAERVVTDGKLDLANLLGPFDVSGTVRDAQLNGLPGVTVTATGLTTKTTATDAQGKYTLADLTAGPYTIAPAMLLKTFSPANKALVLAKDETAVDFAGRQSTYSVSGTITDANSQPVAQVSVSLSDGTNRTYSTYVTDATGAYSFDGLIAGDYTVTPTRERAVFAPASRAVTLGPSETGVDFQTVADDDADGISGILEDQAAVGMIPGTLHRSDGPASSERCVGGSGVRWVTDTEDRSANL